MPAADTPLRIAHRTLLAELDRTVGELGERRGSDTAVHDIRKDLKRARAALRMLRECIGVLGYRRDNALIRDAARPLTPIRDAKVLLQTLDRVQSKTRAGSGLFGRFRKLLEEERRLARRQLRPADLAAAARALRGVRGRVAALPHSRLAAPHPQGLKRAFKKARSAFAAAKRGSTDEALHEWRKQTKYFANQLEMLLPLRAKLFVKSHGYAIRLADCLGEDHDLAILTQQFSKHATAAHAPASASAADARDVTVGRLMRTLRRRRKKLQRRAMRLGRRLYRGKAARYRP
jgi:CHAD domain-containing protein